MDLSLVIPLYNEEESLDELTEWINRVCSEANLDYEIIYIDDGSSDGSWEKLEVLKQTYNNIRGIKFRKNYGKSAALNTGFEEAKGNVIITMDADLQDSPDEIPTLYEMIISKDFDLVSGWKRKRMDPMGKRIPSKFFNWVTRKLSGIQLNDFNCGLKAYSKELIKSIEVYGEMHRYIPVIAKKEGFEKIGEKVVAHQARKYGTTKFGFERVMRGYLDLMSITFISKFSLRPMHFFGSLGTILSFVGFAILLYLTGIKIFHGITGISTRPLFFLGMLSIIVGVQLFIAGFLAEMISRNNPKRNNYTVEQKI